VHSEYIDGKINLIQLRSGENEWSVGMKKISFIHGADLHLDSPMVGLSHLPKEIFERLKESSFTALKILVDAAIHHRVDFVILAGDLFDEQDRSVRAQTMLRKEMERLEMHGIDVYVIHGNHDHLSGDWIHLGLPENVHIFSDKVEVKTYANSEVVVHLYGFSYPTRHVEDNQLVKYIKKEGADFHIGLLHGHFEGNSEHGRYASFTTKELMEKKFDYWALGHIHKRQIIQNSPFIVYPGNIQGRNRKELGEKGCYLVRMTAQETQLDFIETADIIWEHVSVDCKNINSFQDLYFHLQKVIEEKRLNGKGVLLIMTLFNIQLIEKEWISLKNGELLQVLQEDEKGQNSFVWPIAIDIQDHFDWKREELEKESQFYKELFQTAQLESIADSIKPLYHHPTASRYLTTLSEEEKEAINDEALQVLIRLLH
jgi:DNA repair protein SbcD/Mre11